MEDTDVLYHQDPDTALPGIDERIIPQPGDPPAVVALFNDWTHEERHGWYEPFKAQFESYITLMRAIYRFANDPTLPQARRERAQELWPTLTASRGVAWHETRPFPLAGPLAHPHDIANCLNRQNLFDDGQLLSTPAGYQLREAHILHRQRLTQGRPSPSLAATSSSARVRCEGRGVLPVSHDLDPHSEQDPFQDGIPTAFSPHSRARTPRARLRLLRCLNMSGRRAAIEYALKAIITGDENVDPEPLPMAEEAFLNGGIFIRKNPGEEPPDFRWISIPNMLHRLHAQTYYNNQRRWIWRDELLMEGGEEVHEDAYSTT